jgi:hypothetical protein
MPMMGSNIVDAIIANVVRRTADRCGCGLNIAAWSVSTMLV